MEKDSHLGKEEGKLGAQATKRVAAGAHLPTPWLFEPVKRPDDRAEFCLDCSFLVQASCTRFSTILEWSYTFGDTE